MQSDLSGLLAAIAERGRALLRGGKGVFGESLFSLSEALLSHRGEASGVALARLTLDKYASASEQEKSVFLRALLDRFGTNASQLNQAIKSYTQQPGESRAQDLLSAAEPRRQELLRRLNLAPRGTGDLIKMRGDLLKLLQREPALKVVDRDFLHLFSSWFNRGFLELRRIDWSTSASILERIIAYEAVHQIDGWDDLKRRLKPPDRRCFGFFHPQLSNVPLIFVEVALTSSIPATIGELLSADRRQISASEADTAVFYSISNTQTALRGVSFGNFLIKQVLLDLQRELPNLKRFVTLSPVPGFAKWLDGEVANEKSSHLPATIRSKLDTLLKANWKTVPTIQNDLKNYFLPAASAYFLRVKTKEGLPVDPVARFHLGNGAKLERLNFMADVSPNGMAQSYGLMVNYFYDPTLVEKNHKTYANKGEIIASTSIKKADAARKETSHRGRFFKPAPELVTR